MSTRYIHRIGKGHNQTKTRRTHKQFRNESRFICCTVKKPLGSNVPVAEKSRVLKRISKKDSVLHKHQEWLRELQEKRRKVEKEERSKILKRDVTGAKRSKPSVTKEATTSDAVLVKPKPAWCQTEEAHNKAEENGVNDEQALLDFVDDLDFDQYTEDLELQTLMSQVKSRIKSLQKERKKDETRLQACVDSEKAAERAEIIGNNTLVDLIQDLPPDTPLEPEVDDTQSIADSVMSSDSTIKSIHSRKSMTTLVIDAKKRRSQLYPIKEDEHETAIPPPISITHTDDDGARMAEKRSVNKLAFKHRNPSL